MDFLKALLKALGADDEHIKAATADKPTLKPEELAEEILANTKDALTNDEEFIKPLRAAWQGEVLSSKERELVKLSGGKLTSADIAAIPKENRFNKVLALFAERIGAKEDDEASKKTADDKDKEIASLRHDLQTKEERIKKLEEEELPAAKAEATAVSNRHRIEREVEKLLTGTKDRKLVLDVDRTRRLILDEVGDNYDLVLDKGAVVVKQKGKDLLAYAEGKKDKALTLADIVTKAGEEAKLFAQNNGTPPKQGERKPAKDENKPSWKLPGMEKAEAHARASEKEHTEA